MLRTLPHVFAIALTLSFSLPAFAAPPSDGDAVVAGQDDATPKPDAKKKKAARHRSKYGFLPGYRPPEVIAREQARHRYENGPHWYGPAFPGFYRGRWNGGGFGPCYEHTPIGYVWTCGR